MQIPDHYIIILSKGDVMKKKHENQIARRDFLKSLAVAGAGAALISRRSLAQAASDQSSIYKFVTREPGKIKLLALTDLHFFNNKYREKDEHTLEDIRQMVKIFNPELMVIDGDIWFEDDFGKGFKRCKWSCEQLGKMNIPWAFVWGNHDTSEDHTKCSPIIASAANSIYRGVRYDGNYRIELCSNGQDNPFWNLLIVNDGMPESGFQRDQIKWFNEEVDRIKLKYPSPPPAFIFCHVPLTQFNRVWAKGLAKGVKNEPVQAEKGEPSAFAAIKKSGTVKAVICGHDHLNNFYGDLDGVRLEYLRATGYGGYGGEKVKKGGTIITIDVTKPENQFDAITVFADGSTWSFDSAAK